MTALPLPRRSSWPAARRTATGRSSPAGLGARASFWERVIRAWDYSLHLGARVLYLNPASDPRRYDVDVHRDIPYTDSGKRGHLLDVYRPRGVEKSPAVLYVHGGGFAILSKDTHRVMALAFASQGYTVFNINYRIGPRYRYPEPLQDAAAALLWVQEHGAAYGADTSRIVLAGESAGGNLVTTLAYLATHPRPEPFARAVFDRNVPIAAVLPIYGFLDLCELERYDHPRLPWYVKRALHAAAAGYSGLPVDARDVDAPLASPLRRLSEASSPDARPLPPFFIACGTADILLVDSKRLHEVLGERGVDSELSVHPGELHGFNAMVWRPAARAKWRALFRFLSSRGLAPSPHVPLP
jgi:acetyl esterase